MEKKKRKFFSLDPHVENSLPVRNIITTGCTLTKEIAQIPKIPVSEYGQALAAWGLNHLNAEQIEAYRKQRLYTGILSASIFCCILFLSLYNYFMGSFGLFSLLGYAMALFATGVLSLVLFWQADMLAGERFIAFFTYVVKRKWLFSFLVLSLYATAGSAVTYAVPEALPLPDMKVTTSQDLSSSVMSMLMGEKWDEYGPVAGVIGQNMGAGLTSVLLPILGCLNSMALFFVSTFAVYIFTFGTVVIAHSGRWEDNQIFSTFWSPIRTVAAVALCTPLQGGISALHHLVLLAVAMSISMGNIVTTSFLSYVGGEKNAMFQLASPIVPLGSVTFPEMFQVLVSGTAAQKAIENLQGDIPEKETIPKPFTTELIHDTNIFGFKKDEVKGAVIEIYGTRTVKLPKIVITAAKDGKVDIQVYVNAIMKMYERLLVIADAYLNKDLSKRGSFPDLRTELGDIAEEYVRTISTEARRLMKDDAEANRVAELLRTMMNKSDGSTSFVNYGWMTLGIYPFVIAQAQGAMQESVNVNITVEGTTDFDEIMRSISIPPTEMLIVNQYQKEIKEYTGSINRNAGGAYRFGAFEEKGVGQEIIDFLTGIADLDMESVAKDFQTRNPIAVMYSKGETLMTIAAGGITIVGAASGLLDMFNKVPVIGKISPWGFIGKIIGGAAQAWKPLLLIALIGLFTFGCLCCYLLPALPMIYWARAIISWAILVLQTLMGAPFWAAAHILPEGIGFAGQHARRGYIMLLDLFMRPTLLCCAIIISMLLLETITKTLGTIVGFWAEITSIAANYSFIGYFFLTIGFIYVMYVSIKWLFIEAIGTFPTRVIQWCGGRGFEEESMIDAKNSSDLISSQLSNGMGKILGKR